MVQTPTDFVIYLLVTAFFAWVAGEIIKKLIRKEKVDWKQLLLAIILGIMAYNMYIASLTT